jgi:hypothetical protein
MEIWIIGGAIVALMIYASTKIKKSAASAYERETIETEEFSIVKPEGFINPFESDFAFEAYTKEFGAEKAEDFRQCRASLTIENNSGNEGLTENEIIEKDVSIKVYRKIINQNGKTFDLKISVLQENEADYKDRINEMLESFAIK